MAKKHRGRELAFQLLYGLSFSPVNDETALQQAFRLSPGNEYADSVADGFAWRLAQGVWENTEELDRTIVRFCRNWHADRIGRIEMLLLRLALYEMIYERTPAKVVISESLELAKQFGVDNAGSFINGILDAAAKAQPEARGTAKTSG